MSNLEQETNGDLRHVDLPPHIVGSRPLQWRFERQRLTGSQTPGTGIQTSSKTGSPILPR